MYKVKKKVHSEAKPDWMVGVLYQIPPKVYGKFSIEVQKFEGFQAL